MSSPPGFAVQHRDLALLRDLFESRLMTTAHAAAIHFDGRREAAKKRLQKLKVANLVSVRPRRASEPAVHSLTARAIEMLRTHRILDEYPQLAKLTLNKRAQVSELTIQHELAVMDVKAAFYSELRYTDFIAIAEFCTWPLLHEFETCPLPFIDPVVVKPDGFIRFHEKGTDGLLKHSFFLELDRSTEVQETLALKAACYHHYYHSGGFAVRNGGVWSAYRQYPFRVLMVFKTAERRNNTAEKLLQNIPPILTQACLSTFTEVTQNPFGRIWVTPSAYRDAVRGTGFEVDTRKMRNYRRQPEREELVEDRVSKERILEIRGKEFTSARIPPVP